MNVLTSCSALNNNDFLLVLVSNLENTVSVGIVNALNKPCALRRQNANLQACYTFRRVFPLKGDEVTVTGERSRRAETTLDKCQCTCYLIACYCNATLEVSRRFVRPRIRRLIGVGLYREAYEGFISPRTTPSPYSTRN